ncbi:DUF1761 domain-containing protein [Fictibacillus nanhaiensis]|uniref:DUF1761 domain-containing protein n=1 Tax=Fictibacillus nanhaiensis TaxID=742169 RepID=UPI001C97F70B|nr:DUF1761 domain-containing protein [Fictibacillus nanhaiensis]MBY6037519.1 DUF1761 domain-containing protein [Fictibacillus nanhaiensis]
MELNELNVFAILAGGLMYMIYGGIYYSILLGKNKDNQGSGAFKYIFSVITAFISSFFVALLVQTSGSATLLTGLSVGLMIGFIITLVYAKNALFGLMTKRVFMIAIGDHLVIFTLLGALHGLWN